MTHARLLLHEAVGETRAVALDAGGRGVALFHDRWAERGVRLRWGQAIEGTLHKLSPSDGGAFLTLEGGQEGFLSRRDMTGLVKGGKGVWRVIAEAREGKLARVTEAQTNEIEAGTPLERWRANLPGEASLPPETGPDAVRIVEETFEAALNRVAPLEGGGRLQIVPTPALFAIDVDTIGRRQEKGRASARALSIGLLSAQELARQAVLRHLGGALVLDCLGPLARRDGPQVKTRFVETFRALSTRRVDCLPPSPFGLMEAVLEWRWQPLHEAYRDARGVDLSLAVLLAALRQIEREARANPANRLLLALPSDAYGAFRAYKKIYNAALIERFGARIEIIETNREKTEISSQ